LRKLFSHLADFELLDYGLKRAVAEEYWAGLLALVASVVCQFEFVFVDVQDFTGGDFALK